MSFTSSCNTTPGTSPSSSVASQAISIGGLARNNSSQTPGYSSCNQRKRSYTVSSYLSDEDLFGDDNVPYFNEAPSPPRSAEAYLAKPLLPPATKLGR
ncbi:hypothetical protein KC315_g4272 [Hortaea werneckii]|uniref:Uncharacterized protein n=1 Tax=Hortaea werneckii TaxID=91943 RepID=A0A3M7CWL3_HORWE|nr:hypothetical protein KC315_g4272 [Hortaea werneckii]KAI7350898.1 hypothetical protein KC354_g12615 [Hortaea werneckii]KAI7543294.1 hypothetical protein KC331_g7476 [Hortaea werneckii]KAI7708119.1 hypothetical protein KC353_g11223 [Hortaea werneckii]RMY56354.1 hypothetical protein D0865_03697 [Hortaea werneckii]